MAVLSLRRICPAPMGAAAGAQAGWEQGVGDSAAVRCHSCCSPTRRGEPVPPFGVQRGHGDECSYCGVSGVSLGRPQGWGLPPIPNLVASPGSLHKAG